MCDKFYKKKSKHFKNGDENILLRHLCIYTLITDGLQVIKLLLFKGLLCKQIYLKYYLDLKLNLE